MDRCGQTRRADLHYKPIAPNRSGSQELAYVRNLFSIADTRPLANIPSSFRHHERIAFNPRTQANTSQENSNGPRLQTNSSISCYAADLRGLHLPPQFTLNVSIFRSSMTNDISQLSWKVTVTKCTLMFCASAC